MTPQVAFKKSPSGWGYQLNLVSIKRKLCNYWSTPIHGFVRAKILSFHTTLPDWFPHTWMLTVRGMSGTSPAPWPRSCPGQPGTQGPPGGLRGCRGRLSLVLTRGQPVQWWRDPLVESHATCKRCLPRWCGETTWNTKKDSTEEFSQFIFDYDFYFWTSKWVLLAGIAIHN